MLRKTFHNDKFKAYMDCKCLEQSSTMIKVHMDCKLNIHIKKGIEWNEIPQMNKGKKGQTLDCVWASSCDLGLI